MAMEIYVLSNIRLTSISAWQQTIDLDRFDLQLSTETPFESLAGFLQARSGGKKTGFECDHWTVDDVMETYPNIDFGHPWSFALAFRWIGDLTEMHAAWTAAAAYAHAAGGIVFDPQEGKVLTAGEAVDVVHQIERDMPRLEAAMREIIRRLTSKT
jgi:hypothetical protein